MFNSAFGEAASQLSGPSNTEELPSYFGSVCQAVLDSVAPLRLKQPKPKSKPWLIINVNKRQHVSYQKDVQEAGKEVEERWTSWPAGATGEQ